MSLYPPPPRRGIAWLAFAFCIALAAIGFLLGRAETARYWIVDVVGAPAGIGAAAALFVIVCAQAARLLHRREDRR